jgi:hypothetical protein
VLAFRRPVDGTVGSAFTKRPCTAPSIQERQGEAIAFSADGRAYFTSSEGTAPPIHRFGIDPPLRATTITTTTAPATTTTTTPPADPEGEDDVVPTGLIVVGVVVAAGAVVGITLLVRRRHP